jgi:hypothetical protein
MDENTVRILLRVIADTPEPPPAVDLDRARRHGLRRLWIRRFAAPALAMVAVAAAVTVPQELPIHHPERTVAAPRHPSAAPAVTAPERFNPLVPYASFGWLPSGFSESVANSIDVDNGAASGTDFVSREAAAPVAGHVLYLTVSARGACQVAAANLLRQVRAGKVVPVNCDDDSFTATSIAPDVGGRPAVWINYSGGIAWEYAPGAWASLGTSITPAADEPHSRRAAAERGWVVTPRTSADRRARGMTPAQVRAAIRNGELIPLSPATLALLVRVASHVRYGQTAPVGFPFRLTGALPNGWRLTQVSFGVSGGRLIGNGVEAGPAADPTALSVGGSTTPDPFGCNFVTGQSTYVTRLGERWVYRVLDETDKQWQSLCASGPVNGVAGIEVSMDMNTPGSNAPLPGSTELGGVLGVLSRLRFLGTRSAAWTTTPLG